MVANVVSVFYRKRTLVAERVSHLSARRRARRGTPPSLSLPGKPRTDRVRRDAGAQTTSAQEEDDEVDDDLVAQDAEDRSADDDAEHGQDVVLARAKASRASVSA